MDQEDRGEGEEGGIEPNRGGGWIGYFGDEHGHPDQRLSDLPPEQRTYLERQAGETAVRRGRHQATVVVEIYENGEAVPQVQFPKESGIGFDGSRVRDTVETAAKSLRKWVDDARQWPSG